MSSDPLPTPVEQPEASKRDVAAWIVRHKVALMILAILLTALAWGPSRQMELDESIESFYSENDPYLLAYQRSKQDFGGDEFVMVGYYQPGLLEGGTTVTEEITEALPDVGSIFGSDTAEPAEDGDDETESAEELVEEIEPVDPLNTLRELAEKLSAVPGVSASSTQSLPTVLMPPALTIWWERAFVRTSTNREALIEMSRHILIGEDDETTAVVLRLLPETEGGPPRRETFRQIREIAAAQDTPTFVAGEPVQVHDMFRYVEDDSLRLGIWSTALLMAVILTFFRSMRWTLLPVVLVNVVLIWTQALLYLSGLKLSMVSSMLRSLVTIIGIATVMHVTVCYRDFRGNHDRPSAFRVTYRNLAIPVWWVTVTTAIGFASLLTSEVNPVRSFGVMMGLATMLVLPACWLLLPGGALIGKFDADPRMVPGEEKLSRSLASLSRLTERHPWPIALSAAFIMAFTGWGFTKLTVETDFSKNFREESQIVQAITFFEDYLGGVGTWDVSFDVPDTLDFAVIEKVRALAADLRALKLDDGTRLTKVVPISDGVDLVPNLRADTLEEKLEFLGKLQPEFVSSLYNPEQHRMLLVLRGLERQPAEVKLQLIEAVEETARKHFPDAKASGLYVLLAHLISSMLGDQLVNFVVSGIGIFFTMALAFRSWKVGLISLVPNYLPIVLVVGSLGWLEIPINIGTAMIASVSMGLTVDSSILYLDSYLHCRRQGMAHSDAIQQAHGSVGFVLVLINFALVAGFSVLALSHFIPLVYFGVLVSLAMLGGLIGNLLLLPLLLKWVYGKRSWT